MRLKEKIWGLIGEFDRDLGVCVWVFCGCFWLSFLGVGVAFFGGRRKWVSEKGGSKVKY